MSEQKFSFISFLVYGLILSFAINIALNAFLLFQMIYSDFLREFFISVNFRDFSAYGKLQDFNNNTYIFKEIFILMNLFFLFIIFKYSGFLKFQMPKEILNILIWLSGLIFLFKTGFNLSLSKRIIGIEESITPFVEFIICIFCFLIYLSNIQNPISEILKSLFSFKGKMKRSDYWEKGFLISLPLNVAATFIIYNSEEKSSMIFGIIFYIISTWSCIAPISKRLHDHNKSGWLALLLFIPIINVIYGIWIAILVWFIKGSDSGSTGLTNHGSTGLTNHGSTGLTNHGSTGLTNRG